MTVGIDLSKWNEVTNYAEVKDQVDFVILRSGFSTTKDPKFSTFVKNFLTHGVKILGVYNFSYALTVEEVIKEAETVAKTLNNHDFPHDTLVFFDYEYDSLTYARSNGYSPTRTMVTEFTEAFCTRIRELGYRPGIYLNIDFFNNWYTPEILEKYPLWIADWREGTIHNGVLLHQYSATGKIRGIKGPIDMNRYYPENDTVIDKPATDDPITAIAKEVIAGKWGNGEERKAKLLAAIQSRVNSLLEEGK